MAGSDRIELQFHERIARAKEAARLASIAAAARDNASSIPPTSASSAASPAIPDDVKHRIDRLVEFIQRNGPVFEETAKEREKNNLDFEFLRPGALYHDYFVWKKRQTAAPPVTDPSALMQTMPVGAMADVCRLAKTRGLAPYSPIPSDLVLQSAAAPPVEPARLEIRLAEYYRNI
ncbi:hypothetical protein Poli38472_003484 [Pythium oligandrum]|uniref:SURP motif domain-containing protein n=1 Tax=Pythium oligandrum TaxID=41045 RepID=A0A8K1C6W7_PYTOL|nr:hypothetical protein Poli38472_003484 [Pythium oligandrum]|eukprot:TMW57559.1 hypothetical protein Poli38472_003484 [Pythium oligandrum]